jgi:hypothetical protein
MKLCVREFAFWYGNIAERESRKLTFIRDESIVVLRVAAFLDEDVHLLTLCKNFERKSYDTVALE